MRIRVDVEIFESAKKNLWSQNYPDTSGWRLKVPSHCHFNKVWQRFSCDNGKEISAKSALYVQVLFVYQSNLLNAFFSVLIFLFPSPSSWLLELASSVTMQNNSWYATILSVKTQRMGKGRRKRHPQLLANRTNREACIWKQLNLLLWMLATELLLNATFICLQQSS